MEAFGLGSQALILTSTQEHVTLIRLNRPTKRNALSASLISELTKTLQRLDSDEETHAIVLAGSEGAGADIKELSELSSVEAYKTGYLKDLEDGMSAVRKPIIAAVEGYALGGGFELALMCDMVVADKDSFFGLPEVTIGTIPGAGGTQRLTRAVGKYKAMDMILTGSRLNAGEAEKAGLVSKVFEKGNAIDGAIQKARIISSHSTLITKMAKEAVLQAENSTLADGLDFEKKLYYLTFASDDFKEGMSAFLEKRSPSFKGC